MRLINIDLPVSEILNVDADVVLEVPLFFNVKLESFLRDRPVDFCVTWGGKYTIVHVDDEYDFVSVEHSAVHPRLSESNFS